MFFRNSSRNLDRRIGRSRSESVSERQHPLGRASPLGPRLENATYELAISSGGTSGFNSIFMDELVLLRFKPEVTQEHKDAFIREVKTLKNLPGVKDGRFIVGGPSLSDPIKWSMGFEFALISHHENLAALREYQAHKEHHRVTSTYLFPFDEDLCIFDFEVDPEDEYMCAFYPLPVLAGNITGNEALTDEKGEGVNGT
ncbi:hypothetical protein F5X97DRAFT_342009 [Nemania serpens]|nr:hypothetical protein F5X97DRAFT_342009 [Nemania serpens]